MPAKKLRKIENTRIEVEIKEFRCRLSTASANEPDAYGAVFQRGIFRVLSR
jgi:hypothetical protein